MATGKTKQTTRSGSTAAIAARREGATKLTDQEQARLEGIVAAAGKRRMTPQAYAQRFVSADLRAKLGL